MWPLFAYLIFFPSWIDVRKHFRQKKRNLVVIWGGNDYDCDNSTQDGWQPCVVLYRTGICHHHGVILHHLKLTEEKSRNGCGGKDTQIWCWGFAMYYIDDSTSIWIRHRWMVVNGGVNLCWSAGYYNLKKAPYCNNSYSEHLQKKTAKNKETLTNLGRTRVKSRHVGLTCLALELIAWPGTLFCFGSISFP